MQKFSFFTYLMLILVMVLTSCEDASQTPNDIEVPEPTATKMAPSEDAEEQVDEEEQDMSPEVLYVNILWHQHQPLYYKDENGVYTRPWVRVHATKDYYDMAAILKDYPDVHVTFNLTPVLIRQLNDFVENGAKDRYWVLSEIPANELTEEDKRFILARFFDANWEHVIARFPRYQELLDQRGGGDEDSIQAALEIFSEQDFRDLQVWFNLAWFDPDLLAEEPLNALVAKGRDFSEEDKAVLFEQVLEVMTAVIPVHKELQASGQIEVITTPYAHPILPLIYDTDLALVGNPGAEMPAQFTYPTDAEFHLERSVEIYEESFGTAPLGLWPGEGSVAEVVVPMISNAGYQWMATGEPVLAMSLGIEAFTRDGQGTVQEADSLYRPYYVQGESGERVAIFFRDWTMSDKIGFDYSGMSGREAAQDLITRLENVHIRLVEEEAQGPHVVSIILDGENAWENYENDGKDFFHAFYQMLSESELLQTVTPSEYLAMYPEQQQLEELFPGAWFSPNYDTWIGETEERIAWEYLRLTRSALEAFQASGDHDDLALEQAYDYMYLAEGSDWFWWYGIDQDSGQDSYFDEGYRALLAKVFEVLEEEVPALINVPIIQPRAVLADQGLQDVSTPEIDGVIVEGEWNLGGYYAEGLAYAVNEENLFVRLDLEKKFRADDQVQIYVQYPGQAGFNPFAMLETGEESQVLGIQAGVLFAWSADQTSLEVYRPLEEGWLQAGAAGSAAYEDVLEVALPLAELGELRTGDELRIVVLLQPEMRTTPSTGPAQVILPQLGAAEEILVIDDPENDDHGPGNYTYPTDQVFDPQVFDLKTFSVLSDGVDLIFKYEFFAPIENPWGSPNNLALQTLDVYIDKDPGAGTGARMLLPGRNVALREGSGWEYAFWAEGWTSQMVVPDSDTLAPKGIADIEYRIIVEPDNGIVTVRVPLEYFGAGDPKEWGYATVVLSQEGYPSEGVWRVRDVILAAAQWKIGGGALTSNHTRVLDLAWPEGATPTQEEMLSDYEGSTKGIDELAPEDFAQIDLMQP
jgi:alpha-amylase/alpha-mannosidase (GH57 family)